MRVGAIVSLALLFLVTPFSVFAHPQQFAGAVSRQLVYRPQSMQPLTFRGITVLGGRKALTVPRRAEFGPEIKRSKPNSEWDVRPDMLHRRAPLPLVSLGNPTPATQAVVGPDPGFFGFAGLTHRDQRLAGTGAYTNTQFSLEPPDQGLCVGNGFVLETVNDALAVYDTSGNRLSGPTAFSQFFGLPPEIVRSNPLVFGPFLSDPKCYFDPDTQRWFITLLEIATNSSTGAFANNASQLIAVSQTPDPTGGYGLFSFDTTDAGNTGCPCFGDQPLIGADTNGFYISTNEFPLHTTGFNGAQIYAMSKTALAAGTLPTVVHFNAGTIPTPDSGGIWKSVQPATSPHFNQDSQAENGTEFFLSALDFFRLNDNRVTVWALTNTASLNALTPSVGLQDVVIASEVYGRPPSAAQKPGPIPLGTAVSGSLERLRANDDRMNQVVFSAGNLWSGVNTIVALNSGIQDGIAYFAVAPSLGNGVLSADMTFQGYVAVNGENVLFPSIGVNSNGEAVAAFTLVGPDFFPSGAYAPLGATTGNVRLAGPGAAPEDGFSGYPFFGGNGVARWGDYTAAVADSFGNIWTAVEFIPNLPRTTFANWGTFIGMVPTGNQQ